MFGVPSRSSSAWSTGGGRKEPRSRPGPAARLAHRHVHDIREDPAPGVRGTSTADHGDFMGDHGIMLKYLLHYQGLIRVPCIIDDPVEHNAGGVRSDLSGTIDLAPTILGRAGIQPFNGVQGRDLLDKEAANPDSVLIEEDTVFRLFETEAPDRVRTLVTERWRLTYHQAGGWWELYDLASDPDEVENLWGAPNRPAVADELVQQMLAQLVANADTSPLPTGRA